jgi:CheY-like chemotaxis protein
VTRLFRGCELVSQVLKNQIGMEENVNFGRRILVVEDESSVRKAISLLLQIDRHIVTEAANGREALDLVSGQPFDLVVLDFVMPGMLGGEVARNIKRVAPTLPVLMLTAYLEKLNDSDKPVDAVLGKPFAVDELRSAMANLFSAQTAANVPACQTISQAESQR